MSTSLESIIIVYCSRNLDDVILCKQHSVDRSANSHGMACDGLVSCLDRIIILWMHIRVSLA